VNLSIFTEPAPLVVVFTKYDRLLISKKDEFGDQGNEKAKEVYDACVQSLKDILSKLKLPITELLYVMVSGIISHSLYDRCHG
jgi:hypothetical protein